MSTKCIGTASLTTQHHTKMQSVGQTFVAVVKETFTTCGENALLTVLRGSLCSILSCKFLRHLRKFEEICDTK